MQKIFILFIMLVMVSACKRWQHEYPEDGQRSKITPLDRVVGKTWVLTQLSLNGQDYMDTVRERFGSFEMKLFYTKYNPSDETDKARYGGVYSPKQPDKTIIWQLYDNDFKFSAGALFGELDDFILPGYYNQHKHEGTILKLTDKDFKFRINYLERDSIVITNFTAN